MSLLFVFLVIEKSNAQNFQGTAIYSSKRQMGDLDIKSEGMSPEMLDQIKEKMAKAFEKTYVLNFNRFESFYEEDQKLSNPTMGNSGIQMQFNGEDRAKIYKNLKDQKYLSEENVFGKDFLVVDSLPKMNWIMEGEQKKIGNYTCYKAKIIIPVTDEDRKLYEELVKKQDLEKTNFMTLVEPAEETVEAWFTLDIPVSNGPDMYGGLPGLILELHANETVFLCSKIILNTTEKITIKAPKSGKKVTQKEFDKIKQERINQMMYNQQNDENMIMITK